jgi:hypothetical protein
MMSFNGLSLSD